MNIRRDWRAGSIAIAGALLLAACATTPESNAELERARAAVNRVEAMPDSSTLASAELKEAQESLRKTDDAVTKRAPADEISHLAYMTEKQADTAEAKLREARARDAAKNAEADRNAALIEARERETAVAQQRATVAEATAAAALTELENAKQTDRGIVLTLGDVLFDTGASSLKPGAQLTLDRLAGFLSSNPGTRVIIEGHTDNTGSDATNQALSERRAESVANVLRSRGIAMDRFEIVGLGESYPVASNGSSAGRTQNRRVEIVLSDDKGQFPNAARRAAQNY
jgi:outer membrane protein OmpA-like peptidoglycan-associated protein